MAPSPAPDRAELDAVLRLVAGTGAPYLQGLDERPILGKDPEGALKALDGPLPEHGIGAAPALQELLTHAPGAMAHTSGPRCFHFVMGGATPAAMGADMLAPLWDQAAYAWASSPLAVGVERIALGWLKEMFGLPPAWGGILTTGATMANFVSLASARQWWGQEHDLDLGERGLHGLPPIPVLSSGHVHASTRKALGMLGLGRNAVRTFAKDATGAVDLGGMEAALRELDGAPAIVVANAGEVNAGDFDPIAAMADLAEVHNAWLHVDGAFGLFAKLSPRTAHLVAGVERADSVTSDGHKWLNVPYDCGFAFVRDPKLMAGAFAYTGSYLPQDDDPRPNFGVLGPEGSRRARALAVWATLKAYGQDGHRGIIERHLDLAQHLAKRVDEAPELERLAEVGLNIVCFRYRPPGMAGGDDLDDLNTRIGAAVLADGRVMVGTTRYKSQVAFRPALANWRIREEDVDVLVQVVREVGAKVHAHRSSSKAA